MGKTEVPGDLHENNQMGNGKQSQVRVGSTEKASEMAEKIV